MLFFIKIWAKSYFYLIWYLKKFIIDILPCKVIDVTCTSLKRISSRSTLGYFGHIVTSLFKSIPPNQLFWYILHFTDNNHAHYVQDEILTSHSHKHSEHNAYLNKLHYHGLQDSMVYIYNNFSFVHIWFFKNIHKAATWVKLTTI